MHHQHDSSACKRVKEAARYEMVATARGVMQERFYLKCWGRGARPCAPVKALPLGGQSSEAEGAVVNDSPVDCQSRDLTEPQRDRPPLQTPTIEKEPVF